jgi:hypothetical protein
MTMPGIYFIGLTLKSVIDRLLSLRNAIYQLGKYLKFPEACHHV